LEHLCYTEDELDDLWRNRDSEFIRAVRRDAHTRMISRHEVNEVLEKPNVYEEGDKVLVWDKRKTDQHGRKLELNWLGPFYVRAKHANDSYTLEIMNGQIVSDGRTFNHSHLRRYNERNVLLTQYESPWGNDDELPFGLFH
jgi:hypothetical protein